MSALRYAVRHETLYEYGGKVVHSQQQLHLTPRLSAQQRTLEHVIRVTPEPAVRSEYTDAFGNCVTRFELDRPHSRLQVVAQMQVLVAAPTEIDPTQGESWERVREQLCYNAQPREELWLEAMRFRGESPFVRIKRAFGEFARDCFVPGASVVSVADALMSKVNRQFEYSPGATEVSTPLLEVLEARRGVCQDFAHLMIACLRSLGLSARYVSGYLRTHRAPSAPTEADGDEFKGTDASHAWVAVFAPPFGWVQFDPTNNLRVRQEHIAVAWGRDFGDVSPLRGVILGGGLHQPSVGVTVEPLEPLTEDLVSAD